MTSLSDGEVRQSDVMRWAQEQAEHLSPPSLHHVLLYLCLNAFYSYDNDENRSPGNVLRGRSRISTICRFTGLSRTTVKRALRGLQEAGYVIATGDGGDGPSSIAVVWWEAMDTVRAEVRAGGRELPRQFVRETTNNTSQTPTITLLEGNFVAEGGSD